MLKKREFVEFARTENSRTPEAKQSYGAEVWTCSCQYGHVHRVTETKCSRCGDEYRKEE